MYFSEKIQANKRIFADSRLIMAASLHSRQQAFLVPLCSTLDPTMTSSGTSLQLFPLSLHQPCSFLHWIFSSHRQSYFFHLKN